MWERQYRRVRGRVHDSAHGHDGHQPAIDHDDVSAALLVRRLRAATTVEPDREDFDAIYRSLNGYLTWPYGHNPDRALVGETATVGSKQFDTIAEDLRELTNDELRLYDSATMLNVEVVDTTDGIVSLRVGLSAGRSALVDSSGSVQH